MLRLSTSAGCDMTSVNQTQLMTGTYLERNCDTSAGNVRNTPLTI